MKKKLPPFGRELSARLQYNNPPLFVVICTGKDGWQFARQWNQRPDFSALVLPPNVDPGSFHWPVDGLICLIEWTRGPSDQFIIGLIKSLFKADVTTIIVKPNWVDYKKYAFEFDPSTGQWK